MRAKKKPVPIPTLRLPGPPQAGSRDQHEFHDDSQLDIADHLALSPTKKVALGHLGLSSESPKAKPPIDNSLRGRYGKEQLWEFQLRKARMLKFQRTYATTDSIKFCGLHAIPVMGQSPALNITAKGYSFSGLQSCGNRSCINCAGRAVHKKVQRIRDGRKGANIQGAKVLFVTLTTKRSNSVKEQIAELRKGWKAVQNRLGYDVKRNGGKYDTVRALDVTFKPNWGNPFHLHLHCLIIIKTDKWMLGKDGNEPLQDRIKAAFSRKAWNARIAAQDVRIVRPDSKSVDDYIAKFAGLGWELSNTMEKTGKQGISLGQLIDRASSQSPANPRMVWIYKAYQTAMKGVKTMSFSKTWDRWIIPEEEEQEEEQAPALIISKPWWELVRPHQHRMARLVWKDVNYAKGVKTEDLDTIMRAPPDLHKLLMWMENQDSKDIKPTKNTLKKE